MTIPLRIAAIIPARMASSRLPGKPLLTLQGLPMIEHVRRRALLCQEFAEVVVATCDREIAEAVARYGGRAIMTSPAHPGATDRVAEAMQQLECTHAVNLQGDEILVLPSDLDRLVDAMRADPIIPAWNALARIEHAGELSDRAAVKCVISISGRVLVCARDFSQAGLTVESRFEPVRRILGVMGFRRDFLERYGKMARTGLELAEAIDQSRIIEHDVVLQGMEFSRGYPGLNERREIEIIERYLTTDPAQQTVLEAIVGAWPARSST